MKLILFDDGKGELAPLTDLRPAFGIRTGAWTAVERWSNAGMPPASLLVPEHMAELASALHSRIPVNQTPPEGAVLVNGRWPLAARFLEDVAALEPGHGLVHDGALLAACVASGGADPLSTDSYTTAEHEAQLLDRCWHVRSLRDECLSYDLAHMAPAKGVVVREGARVAESAVLDASSGAIVIGENATVGHHAVVIGPAYVGPGSTIVEHATIRPNTAIGPVCKVGGEATGVIFQGYANKAHEGFLGDSYVGMWCNLGAGTTNSNLLNTYGPVVVDRQRTGETFLGCVLGDHVKTAISTRIMTGAVVGTGTMWAATSPIAGRVGAMRWVTDVGEKAYRPEKFLEVARAAMARRDAEPTQAEIARFASLTGD
ncbi:MAG: putative sugar nucleotidyl transferase [Phycisphaerales bacterium JB060]